MTQKGTKDHWLIAYMVRRVGKEEWTPANMVWRGTPASALKDLMKLNEEYGCEHVVTNAIPITAAEYKMLEVRI